jgi:group I intron endonuclease
MKDIYIIRNVINGKIYIGQSNDVDERWYKHVWDAKNRITNMPLHEDIRLYGEDKFNYTVIEQCSDEIANDREQFWIKYFNATGPNGYNVIGRGVDNPNAIFDKETLNNIIANNTGQPLEKVKRDTERDYYMSATEAVEYGLIDKVITKETR